MKVKIQRSIACCFGLILGLAVNSRMTMAWLTPSSSSITVHSRQVIRRRSFNSQYVPITATATVAAAKMKLNGDNNQNQVSPRNAVEVSDLPQAEQLEDRPLTATTREITTTSIMTQQQQHMEILQGHPIVQRILGDDDELSLQQKVINLLFLSAAFGYAVYNVVQIDSGMTRGWTTQEQLMRIPLDNWGAYESYLANKPILTKTLINVIIYLLGDWLSQTVFQGKHVLSFDISRVLRNGFIGLCFGEYRGCRCGRRSVHSIAAHGFLLSTVRSAGASILRVQRRHSSTREWIGHAIREDYHGPVGLLDNKMLRVH